MRLSLCLRFSSWWEENAVYLSIHVFHFDRNINLFAFIFLFMSLLMVGIKCCLSFYSCFPFWWNIIQFAFIFLFMFLLMVGIKCCLSFYSCFSFWWECNSVCVFLSVYISPDGNIMQLHSCSFSFCSTRDAPNIQMPFLAE